MSTTHPVMLAYEQTKNTAIPLILVVGREPNKGSGISVSCVEDIPFRKVIEIDEDGKKKKIHFSRCGLWNISFKIIITPRTIKV